MFVQRLTSWFSRLFASLTGRARHASSLPSARQPVASGSISSSKAISASWLDDSQRLRPHVRPPLQSEPRRANKSVSQRLAQAKDFTRGIPPAPQMRPPAPNAPNEPAQPVQSAPASTQPSGSADDAERRLMFLRYLVRQGVYNEGFSRANLPEQYLRNNEHGGLPPSDD